MGNTYGMRTKDSKKWKKPEENPPTNKGVMNNFRFLEISLPVLDACSKLHLISKSNDCESRDYLRFFPTCTVLAGETD